MVVVLAVTEKFRRVCGNFGREIQSHVVKSIDVDVLKGVGERSFGE